MEIFYNSSKGGIYIAESPDKKLPEDNAAYEKLQNKISSLEFLPVDGAPASGKALDLYNKKKYILNKNPMDISDIQFIFDGV